MSTNDPTKKPQAGVTRRGFLGSVGAGSSGLAATASTGKAAAEELQVTAAGEMSRITLRINGRVHSLAGGDSLDPARRPSRPPGP